MYRPYKDEAYKVDETFREVKFFDLTCNSSREDFHSMLARLNNCAAVSSGIYQMTSETIAVSSGLFLL